MLRIPPPALALLLAVAAPGSAALAAGTDATGGLSGLVPPGAASTTATAPAAPTARLIDLSVLPSRLFSGQQATLSGQVVSADDKQRPLAGYAVQAVDGARTLDQTVTDEDGRFDLSMAPTRSMDVAVQVGPDANGQAVVQEPVPPIRLLVAPRLPHQFPNRLKYTSVLTVTGWVVPAIPGARLVLEQRVRRRVFRPLATAQTDDRSRYRFTRDFAPGTYVLRVRFPGSADLAPAAYVFRYSVEPASGG